jgi:hypothetical protein
MMLNLSTIGRKQFRSPYVIAVVAELILFLSSLTVMSQRGLHDGGPLMIALLVTQMPGIAGALSIGEALNATEFAARGANGGFALLSSILAIQLLFVLACVWLVRQLMRWKPSRGAGSHATPKD